MNIKKPQRISLSAQIVSEMERLIGSGQWQVGKRIPTEPELMRLFSVSRNTVREAVQALIHAGLLTARPGDGTYVQGKNRLEILIHHELSRSELDTTFEARLALETAIVELAAHNRTTVELQLFSELLEKRNTSNDQYVDAEFHMAIAQATHNPLLTKFYNEICRYMLEHLADKPLEGDLLTREITLHNHLIESIAAQDAEQAKATTSEIISVYRKRMSQTNG